jgi:hypothetical protein
MYRGLGKHCSPDPVAGGSGLICWLYVCRPCRPQYQLYSPLLRLLNCLALQTTYISHVAHIMLCRMRNTYHVMSCISCNAIHIMLCCTYHVHPAVQVVLLAEPAMDQTLLLIVRTLAMAGVVSYVGCMGVVLVTHRTNFIRYFFAFFFSFLLCRPLSNNADPTPQLLQHFHISCDMR